MKIRICLAPGTWQLIMLTSALQQAYINCNDTEHTRNYLVVQGFGLTNQLKDSILKTANHLNDWEKIIIIDEFYESNLVSNYWNFDNLLKHITDRIGIEQADEIWVCKLKGLTERLIFEAYPDSKIFLYEDGLGTYNPLLYGQWEWKSVVNQPIIVLKILLKLAKKYLIDELTSYGRSYNSFRISSYHIRRLSGVYLYLAKDIKNQVFFCQKPQFTIADNILISTIKACDCLVDIDSAMGEIFSSVDKCVLLLGQCFALSTFMDFDRELSIYCQVIALLLEKGYTVLWKEHPRVNKPFFPRLAKIYSSTNLKELGIYSTFSIEVMVERINIFACVAASSSSLFYLPKIYNIKTYSCAKEFLPYAKGIVVSDLEFVAKNITPVDEIQNLLEKDKSKQV